MFTYLTSCPPSYFRYTVDCRNRGKFPLMYQLWSHNLDSIAKRPTASL